MLMTQATTTRYAASDNLGLAVTSTGSTVTVKAGKFKINNVEYTLAEDQSYVVAVLNPEFSTSIFGYLVKVVETGAVALLVDEVSGEPGDVPFSFAPGSPYQLLTTIFEIQLVPGSPDFATLGCKSFKIDPFAELKIPNPTLPSPRVLP